MILACLRCILPSLRVPAQVHQCFVGRYIIFVNSVCYISYDFLVFSLIRKFLRPVYVAVGISCLFHFIIFDMVPLFFCPPLSPWAPSTLLEVPLPCCPSNCSALPCVRSQYLLLLLWDSARDTSMSAHRSMNTLGPSPVGLCVSLLGMYP